MVRAQFWTESTVQSKALRGPSGDWEARHYNTPRHKGGGKSAHFVVPCQTPALRREGAAILRVFQLLMKNNNGASWGHIGLNLVDSFLQQNYIRQSWSSPFSRGLLKLWCEGCPQDGSSVTKKPTRGHVRAIWISKQLEQFSHGW